MSLDDGKSIWVGDGERFFLVPDDLDLLPGPMTVQSLLGRKRQVDPAAIASFEISKEAANERLRGKATAFVESLKGAVFQSSIETGLRAQLDAFKSEMQNLAANFKKAMQELAVAPPPPPQAPPPVEEEAPVEEVSSVEAAAPVEEAASVEEEAPVEAAAPAEIAPPAEIAAPAEPAPGALLVESLRAFPKQLEAALTSPEVEQLLRDAAVKLQQLADRLRERKEPDSDPPSA